MLNVCIDLVGWRNGLFPRVGARQDPRLALFAPQIILAICVGLLWLPRALGASPSGWTPESVINVIYYITKLR